MDAAPPKVPPAQHSTTDDTIQRKLTAKTKPYPNNAAKPSMTLVSNRHGCNGDCPTIGYGVQMTMHSPIQMPNDTSQAARAAGSRGMDILLCHLAG